MCIALGGFRRNRFVAVLFLSGVAGCSAGGSGASGTGSSSYDPCVNGWYANSIEQLMVGLAWDAIACGGSSAAATSAVPAAQTSSTASSADDSHDGTLGPDDDATTAEDTASPSDSTYLVSLCRSQSSNPKCRLAGS